MNKILSEAYDDAFAKLAKKHGVVLTGIVKLVIEAKFRLEILETQLRNWNIPEEQITEISNFLVDEASNGIAVSCLAANITNFNLRIAPLADQIIDDMHTAKEKLQ